MKKSHYISILLTAGAFCPLFGQISWNQLPLTGAEAKIISVVRQPKFSAGLTVSFPLGHVAGQNIPISGLQNAAFSPETATQLFERLGGQFFIGTPSAQQEKQVTLNGRAEILPGIQLGFRPGSRLEIRAGAQHFQYQWAGVFPVTVFPQQQEHPVPPETIHGTANASSSGLVLNVETAFYITRGVARPYISGGVRGLFPGESDSHAAIAGVDIPLKTGPVKTSISAVGSVGIRWHFWKNAFFDAGCSFGKWPDGKYRPAAQASVGCAF